jgi:hypothetical protein
MTDGGKESAGMSNGTGDRTPVQPQYKYDPKTSTYTLVRFTTPACNNDFPDDPATYEKLAALWSQNVDGFTQQAICGTPWNSQYQSNQTGYYNPLTTPVPKGSFAVDVAWIAFPNRLIQYLGQQQQPPNPYSLPMSTLFQLADSGELSPYPIPQNRCPLPNWNGPLIPFGPYGPRGWLDEYCEFSVTRDANNKIVRIDFTCENPEYFQTLWRISPQRAAQVYQDTLNAGVPASRQIAVTVEDLQLVDPKTGQPVIDPQTGRPAYNPLNKWNSGTISQRTGTPAQRMGGAMHLTATPNTLQTELGLGAGATVQRNTPGVANDPQALICCSVYGQNYRNSDPHIGQSVNLAVGRLEANLSLADPPGLYIQMPSFAQYALPADPKLPKGAQPSDCWQILRGFERLTDPITGEVFPGSFILHAAFQLPPSWIDAGVSFTVGDITIAGQPIQYASQVAATLEVALFGRPIVPAPNPTPALPCVPSSVPNPQAAPIQSMYANVWDAYYGTIVHPPTDPPGGPEVLASNSNIIPPTVPAGQTVQLVLVYDAPESNPDLKPAQWPKVVFTQPGGAADPSITATVTGYEPSIYYAPPGNSYPSTNQLLRLTVEIAAKTPPGVRGVVIVASGQNFADIPPAPAYLVVGGPNS